MCEYMTSSPKRTLCLVSPTNSLAPRGPNVIVFPDGGEEAEAGGRENHGDLEREPPTTNNSNHLRAAGERAWILTPALPL